MVLRSGFDVTIVLVAVAESLRDIHATPLEQTDAARAPLGPAGLLDLARTRVAAGRVDQARFDAPYQRYSPDELLALAERGQPDEPAAAEVVLVLGTARLDTVRLLDGRVTGWVAARGGPIGSTVGEPTPGDRYRDLATMAVDLAARISPEAIGPFLDAYGLDHPDVVRLDWHVLVDQLLR